MTPEVQTLLTEQTRVLHGDDDRLDGDSSTAHDAVAVLTLVPDVRALMLLSSPAVEDAERARDVGAPGTTPPGPWAA